MTEKKRYKRAIHSTKQGKVNDENKNTQRNILWKRKDKEEKP